MSKFTQLVNGRAGLSPEVLAPIPVFCSTHALCSLFFIFVFCLSGRWEIAVLAVHTFIQTGPSEDQRAEETLEQLFPCQPPGEGAV